MKKYGFLVLLVLLVILVVPGIGHADSSATHINLDGNELTISKDAQVQIINGSVMVPLRLVAEQLGYAVKWDNGTKTATIEQAGMILRLVLNSATAEASGRQVELDTPPFLSGSIILVPLRFVGEETGVKVSWDNLTKTVYLTSPLKTPESSSSNGTGDAPVDTGTTLTDLSFSDSKLMIHVNGTVNPRAFTMTDKDRIVLDLPNTSFSQTFIQNLSLETKQSGVIEVTGNNDVSTIRFSLFSNAPSTIRVVIDLNSTKSYNIINANDGLIIIDLNGTGDASPPINIPAAPVPSSPPSIVTGKKLVIIDAGHGGKDPGGISLSKHNEKDFALATALKIQELLKNDPEIDFVLTRNDDSYPTLQDRVKVANNLKADLFVSIHGNSIPAGSKNNPSGFETYYTRMESQDFAKIVHKYLISASDLSDRGVRQGNLYVTRETRMPAILLECGYLSNPKDEALLFNDAFQQRVAEAVAAGIKEYLGL